jgi:hypothetical protein
MPSPPEMRQLLRIFMESDETSNARKVPFQEVEFFSSSLKEGGGVL